jgi:colicin import membrane protein
MFLLSAALHLALFASVFLFPKPLSTRAFKGVVYEVNLVEMPTKGPAAKAAGPPPASSSSDTGARSGAAAQPAKRITAPPVQERPVVIAKRTIKATPEGTKKPEVPTSKLIDDAVSKIESKVKQEKEDPLNRALAGIEERVKDQKTAGPPAPTKSGSGEGAQDGGLALRLYELQIYDAIKRNWSYPVDLSFNANQGGLEAVAVMRVRRDGRILKVSLEKRSRNAVFDQSVLKAIERSDPLPPFPDFYREREDDIQVTFTLSDLERR